MRFKRLLLLFIISSLLWFALTNSVLAGTGGGSSCNIDEIISELGKPQFALAHLTSSAPKLPDTTVNAQYLFTLEPSTRQAVIKGFFPNIPSKALKPFHLLARLPSLPDPSDDVYFHALGNNQASEAAFTPSTQERTYFEFRLPIEYFESSGDNYVFPGPLKIYLKCADENQVKQVIDWPVAFYFPIFQRFHQVQRAGYFALASNGVLNQ